MTATSALLSLVWEIVAWMRALWERLTGPVLVLDSGRHVRIGRKIAEGGFSFVFRATDTDTKTLYALKRIRCEDPEALKACRKEAEVHRSVSDNENTLRLLGLAFERNLCYMLFPYMPYSLRAEVNRRIFTQEQDPHQQQQRQGMRGRFSRRLRNQGSQLQVQRQMSDQSLDEHIAPWSELAVLKLFRGILSGVEMLHAAGYSHRDIKLENVLFTGSNNIDTPVLMDFGSAGPLKEPIRTRRQVLQVIEGATTNTTMPYRPPELFEGGIQTGDPPIDFTKVDAWSLGCTLYGILYGSSPFECEFQRTTGSIRIVDCTQLRIIGSIPYPPEHTAPSKWYTAEIKELIAWILTQDRSNRPNLKQVIARVDVMIDQDEDPIDVLLDRNVM